MPEQYFQNKNPSQIDKDQNHPTNSATKVSDKHKNFYADENLNKKNPLPFSPLKVKLISEQSKISISYLMFKIFR